MRDALFLVGVALAGRPHIDLWVCDAILHQLMFQSVGPDLGHCAQVSK